VLNFDAAALTVVASPQPHLVAELAACAPVHLHRATIQQRLTYAVDIGVRQVAIGQVDPLNTASEELIIRPVAFPD
jgi:hypothetical protein